MRSASEQYEADIRAELLHFDEVDPQHRQRFEIAVHRERTGVDRVEAELGETPNQKV